MSKAIIEKVVTDFIGARTPGVLAVTGSWGVGKTFLLRETIAKYRGTDGLTKYAYASAFGVQTISEIRTMLLAKTRKLPFEDSSSRGVRGWVEEKAAKRNLGAATRALKENDSLGRQTPGRCARSRRRLAAR
ncbi:Cdc6-like AAA superfamily ATPase [Paraburkholderia sp. GAS199]|uniref:P-loop NTPase fold protein n=1 Tax=Paraburkholderia sp. GAS199 TaxID=3035126 RepID=UPI003D1C9E4C